ncbi:MAG: hypothetical protein WC325_11090 [Candidatus Bathyarchaeia archaeon]|jgi:hypothetical protein
MTDLRTHAIVAALITGVLGLTYFTLHFLYSYLKVYQTVTNEAYQQLTITILIIIALIALLTYAVTPKPKKPKTHNQTVIEEAEIASEPKISKAEKEKLRQTWQILNDSGTEQQKNNFKEKYAPYMEEIIPQTTQTKEQDRIDEINQKIKTTIKPQSQINQITTDPASGEEPDWSPINPPEPPTPAQIQKEPNTSSMKETLENSKIRVHNAFVNNLVRQLEAGDINVEPTEETIKNLGLGEIKLIAKKKPAPLEKETQSPILPIPIPAPEEIEMEKPLLSRRRDK